MGSLSTNMKFWLLGIFYTLASAVTIAQISVDNELLTVSEGIQTVMLGEGIDAFNIRYNGSTEDAKKPQAQFGSFLVAEGDFAGMQSGVILGTGDVKIAERVNSSNGLTLGGSGELTTDEDLLTFVYGGKMFDQCVVEFDFIPLGDTIAFEYVFASEEYEEYVCSEANDAFGFFLSGPNPGGGNYDAQNLALIPDTNDHEKYTSTQVSINTLNPGIVGGKGKKEYCDAIDPNWRSYKKFYVKNIIGTYEYDGRTVRLKAVAPVKCGEVYSIKLAVGDGGDPTRDSGVFIKGGSFSTTNHFVKPFSFSGDQSDAVFEGCNHGGIVCYRNSFDLQEHVEIDFFGSALLGADYNLDKAKFHFEPGQKTDTLLVEVLIDSLPEGPEQIFVDWSSSCSSAVLNIMDVQPLKIERLSEDVTICPENEDIGHLEVSAAGGFGKITYSWSDNSTGKQISVAPELSTEYSVVARDECGNLASSEEKIFVQVECPIHPVNVFTPNGDGINDYLTFPNLDTVKGVVLFVFNRWGKLVYFSEKYNNQWDGREFTSGSECGAGVYTYVIKPNSAAYDYEKVESFNSGGNGDLTYGSFISRPIGKNKFTFAGYFQLIR